MTEDPIPLTSVLEIREVTGRKTEILLGDFLTVYFTKKKSIPFKYVHSHRIALNLKWMESTHYT